MSFEDLPSELLLNIFHHCYSISSAINLSLTCRRLYNLLRTSQKLPVLFAIAERTWGPLEDIHQLLTHNASQPVHVKRTPALSFALLVQISCIGRVAVWYQDLYTKSRWDGDKACLRRELTHAEAFSLRRAIYRIWLYSKAFHTSSAPRTMRMSPILVAERCQLLRTWTTDELLELEDVRVFLEGVIASELCPTDGEVFWARGGDAWNKRFYDPSNGHCHAASSSIHSIFHDCRSEAMAEHAKALPATQRRELYMDGWGDEIDRYHALSSMLKLNPAQIMLLHEEAVTKQDVERFVENAAGGQWFWNNGETMLHTWILVLHDRGVCISEIRDKIYSGLAGIVVDDV